MYKSLSKNFNSVKIELQPGLVKVYSNLQLWEYLTGKNHSKIVSLLVEIKKEYFERYGKALNISNSSLMVEILAHVYCHGLGLKIFPYVKLDFIRKFLKKLIDRAQIVDCGERTRDSNRWVWNFLAHFNKVILAFFPFDLNVSNLSQNARC